MRCADCKHFRSGDDNPEHAHGKVYTERTIWGWMPGYGTCSRWKIMNGGEQEFSTLPRNEVAIANDSFYNVVGPDFGCVLFEPKQ